MKTKTKPQKHIETEPLPGAKPVSRGALKEGILAELKAAGPGGLSIAALAKKLRVEPANIHVWFSTTGKKLPEIEKIDAGRFAFVPPPYINDGDEDRRPDVDYALGVAMKAAEAKGWDGHESDFLAYANIVEFAIDDITAGSVYPIKPPTVDVVEAIIDLIDWDNDLTPYPVVWHIWQDAVDTAKGQPTREQVEASKKKVLLEALSQDLRKSTLERLTQLYVSANHYYQVIGMKWTPRIVVHSTPLSS